MKTATNIPEVVWSSIQQLSPESLEELVNFIDYLNYKNKPQTQAIETSAMTPAESDFIIEQILTEVGDSLPSLSDYAVSRSGIYGDHP